MTVDQFFSQNNNKGLDYDGAYGNQCVDLFRFYERDVTGGKTPPVPGAKDLWDKYDTSAYTRIQNTPTAIPLKGDVIIWGREIGPYGHVGIFKEGTTSSFISFDQNWPDSGGKGVSHFVSHNYKGVIGWLRPTKKTTMLDVVSMGRFKDTATVYGIIAFHHEEEFKQVGKTWTDVVIWGNPKLVKEYGNPEVSLQYAIPSFKSVEYLGLTPENNLVEDTRSNDIKKLRKQLEEERDENDSLSNANIVLKSDLNNLEKAIVEIDRENGHLEDALEKAAEYNRQLDKKNAKLQAMLESFNESDPIKDDSFIQKVVEYIYNLFTKK